MVIRIRLLISHKPSAILAGSSEPHVASGFHLKKKKNHKQKNETVLNHVVLQRDTFKIRQGSQAAPSVQYADSDLSDTFV